MTRDPQRILTELASIAAVDAEQRSLLFRTEGSIANERAKLDALEHYRDDLLCSMERRRMAQDALLDELLARRQEATCSSSV